MTFLIVIKKNAIEFLKKTKLQASYSNKTKDLRHKPKFTEFPEKHSFGKNIEINQKDPTTQNLYFNKTKDLSYRATSTIRINIYKIF